MRQSGESLEVNFQRSRSPPWSRRFPPPSFSCGGCSSWGRPSSAPPSAPPQHCHCCCCQDSLRSGRFWTRKETWREEDELARRDTVTLCSIQYTLWALWCKRVYLCVFVCSHSLSSSWSISGSMSNSALLGNAPPERGKKERIQGLQLHYWTVPKFVLSQIILCNVKIITDNSCQICLFYLIILVFIADWLLLVQPHCSHQPLQSAVCSKTKKEAPINPLYTTTILLRGWKRPKQSHRRVNTGLFLR